MTSKRKDGSIKGTRLTGLTPTDSTYDVGYGKPPTATKFKTGSSGNPNGRPKGSKNRSPFDEERFASIFMDEANRKIKINEGGRKIRIPIIQAAMRALMVNAAKGEIRSLRFVIDRFMAEEAKQKQWRADFFEAAVEYKVQCREIMAERQRTGAAGPEPILNPDYLHINGWTGEVEYREPMTGEQLAFYEKLCQQIAMWQEDIDTLTSDLLSSDFADVRHLLEKDLERAKARLNRLEQIRDQHFPRES